MTGPRNAMISTLVAVVDCESERGFSDKLREGLISLEELVTIVDPGVAASLQRGRAAKIQ